MNKKILVVEDDVLLNKAVTHYLTKSGYEVISAGDGEEAIDIVVSQNIELVICDIMLPKISGYTFLTSLKTSIKMDIPVIMISTLATGKQIAESLGDEKVIFILKPFAFETLSNKVKHFIG